MNLDSIMDSLNFAIRQKISVYDTIDFFKNFFSNGFSFKRIFAGFMVVVEMFGCVLFDNARTPRGEALDLTGYSLVFEDEFEGTELNTDVWKYRGLGSRRFGFNGKDAVEVKDGNLVLSGYYDENGEYGAGWYTGMISLIEHYNKGYFEIKCICNKDKGFWSAFWIQADHPYDHYLSNGGIGGAEIDIFEAMDADAKLKSNRNAVSQTIHCNGVDDDIENIDSFRLGVFKGNNIYEEYNTYGLKWTDDEYIFYINGVESARGSYGKGVSLEPEEVIVSLEIPEQLPEAITSNKDYKTQMIVDYVKIYQLSK